MALFSWFGGAGQYGVARLWSPRGVPGAGDTARVASGDVVVSGRSVAAVVELGGTGGGAAPVLELRNASVSELSMPNDLPGQPYATQSLPAEHGTVNVRGHSSIGSLRIGNFANQERADPPYGHGPLFAVDNLSVNLVGRAALATGFDVKEGSTLTVNGGAGSSFQAGNSTIEGGKVVVSAPLAGRGTITMTDGTTYREGFTDAGTLELGGRVGAGQTIDINVGRLLIDKPLDFAGTLNIRAQEGGGSGSAYEPSYTGTQDVMLRGLAADSYSFDDAAHALTLWDGNAALDVIQFSAGTTSASFKMGAYAAVDVLQTPEGVQLRGLYDFGTPAGSTEIPLHAATA